MTLPAFLGNSGKKLFTWPVHPHGPCFCMGDKPSQSPAATSSPGRGKSFHSGDALGKEGRSRPHRLLARKSLPLSCKLFALAKASPFRERWHGEAVTERVAFRNKPSQSRCARQLSRRASPWQNRRVSSSIRQRQEEASVKLQTFRLCQSLSLSGEVARRSRDGEGCFRDEPSQSRCARQLVPLFVAYRRHLPPAGGSLSKGEPLAEPASFVLIRQRQEEVSR